MSDYLPAEIRFTWDELNSALVHAPRRIVETGEKRISYHDGAEHVALLVARRLGIRLVVERDAATVVEYEAFVEDKS